MHFSWLTAKQTSTMAIPVHQWLSVSYSARNLHVAINKAGLYFNYSKWLSFLSCIRLYLEGTWCRNDVAMKSTRRHHVASTSIQRQYDVMCLLSIESIYTNSLQKMLRCCLRLDDNNTMHNDKKNNEIHLPLSTTEWYKNNMKILCSLQRKVNRIYGGYQSCIEYTYTICKQTTNWRKMFTNWLGLLMVYLRRKYMYTFGTKVTPFLSMSTAFFFF